MIRSIIYPMWRALLPIILALMLGACQAVVHEKGSIIKPELVDQIVEDVTNHEEVLTLLGPPTHVNPFQSNRWLYMQDRSYKDQQVIYARAFNTLEIVYDDNGIVLKVNRNFEDDLIDPTNLPEAMKGPSLWKRIVGDQELGLAEAAKKPGLWKRLWGSDDKALAEAQEEAEAAGAEIGAESLDGEKTSDKSDAAWWKFWKKNQEENQKVASTDNPEEAAMETKDPSLFQRFLNTFKNKPKSDKPPPDLTFSKEDADWWKGVFEHDPTQGGLVDPTAKPPENEKQKLLDGRSWWKFW